MKLMQKITASLLLGALLVTQAYSVSTENDTSFGPQSNLFMSHVEDHKEMAKEAINEKQLVVYDPSIETKSSEANTVSTIVVADTADKKSDSISSERLMEVFGALPVSAQQKIIGDMQDKVQERLSADRTYLQAIKDGIITVADFVVDTSIRTTAAVLGASAGASAGIMGGIALTPHVLPFIFNPWVVSIVAPIAAPCLAVSAGFVLFFEGGKLGWHAGGPLYQNVLKPVTVGIAKTGYKVADVAAKATFDAASYVASAGVDAAGKALGASRRAAGNVWNKLRGKDSSAAAA